MANILLVDDEPRMLSLLNSLLKAEGYEVIPFQDGSKSRSCSGPSPSI